MALAGCLNHFSKVVEAELHGELWINISFGR